MKIDKIYIDGASRGNPGLASYAVIVYQPDGNIKKLGEVFEFKTNNQMELLAGYHALRHIANAVKSKEIPVGQVTNIYTDSALLANMFNKGWIYNWEVKGTIDKHPNSDLIWSLLLESYKIEYRFKFNWVKGHSGIEGNELADQYCNQLLDNYGK